MDENAEANAFVGKTLAGKYRVDGVIGVGGMGFVLAATHLHIDEPVAVKLLYTSFAQNQEVVKRFIREAKAARKIRSEHVVRVLDVDTLDENGAPYIVMEHLQGQDLEAIIRRLGKQPIATALDVILQASEALAEAHVQKMVHRDLKPANLFVTKRPDGDALVKVLDFGISKVTGAGGADLNVTQAGDAILGSPQYMAPEQLKSLKDVDARTDIWALGSILYEMLTANPPFNAMSLPELCTNILERPPPSLRAIRPDVSPGLEAVILKCLAKERDGRPNDIAALATALAPFCPPNVQASAGRIAGVFRTARFIGQKGGVGGTIAIQAVPPMSSGPNTPAPVSDTAPITPQQQSGPRISSPPSGQNAPKSSPPPTMPSAIAQTVAQPAPKIIGVATTGNAFSKDRVSTRPPPPQAHPVAAIGVAVGAVVVVALLVLFVAIPWARSRHTTAIPSATTSAPPVAESVVPPPKEPTPPPVESAALPVHDASVATSASAAPSSSVSASPIPTVAVPAVNCNPPFTIDEDGIKRWKRGCVVK